MAATTSVEKRSTAVMPTSFKFLTFSDLSSMRDASTKSQIRKHAMKDIGITRRRPKKASRRVVELPVDALTQALIPPPHPKWSSVQSGIDPFIKFPVELDHIGRELVENSERMPVSSSGSTLRLSSAFASSLQKLPASPSTRLVLIRSGG